MQNSKPRLFSGIQPSGHLTLGNYLGALKNWIGLQQQYNCLFALVDLHTITVRQDAKLFYEYCYDTLALYLAAGLNPQQHHIFLQSHVAAHSQLAWILNCYCYVGELNRMTQFKDKSKKNAGNINIGLFSYPALMAADILLYDTNLVPVGIDQKQHIEITRDLALRFNSIYGEIFVIPEGYFPPLGARIMSLQDPTKKMSKSDINPSATIFLLDSPETILDKCKRAVTDSGKEIYFDAANKPGIANLLTILATVSNKSIDAWCSELQNYGYSKLKEIVAEHIINCLRPLQEEYRKLRKEHLHLDTILKQGATYANAYAQKTLQRAHDAIGFIRQI